MKAESITNDPLTDRGHARLARLTAAKKEELQFAWEQIQRTRDQIVEIDRSVSILHNTINHTRHAVDVLEKSRQSLAAITNSITGLDLVSNTIAASKNGHPAPEICQTAARLVGSINSAEELADQGRKWIVKGNQLKEVIFNLELELREWNFELAFHRGHLAHIEAYYASVEDVLNGAKVLLSPVRIVPPEIWVKIFEYWIKDRDLATTHLSLPSPLVLGHVCSKWRQIVHGTPKLWKRCDLYPFTWWPQSLLNIFMQSRRAGGGNNAIRYHFLAENLPTWSIQARQSSQTGRAYVGPRFGRTRRLVQVPADEMLHISSVHFKVTSQLSFDNYSHLPLANFHNVVIRGNSTDLGGELASFIKMLSSVEELKMEDVWFTGATSISMPHLRRLAFHFDQFNPSDISILLHANLEELIIRHNGTNTISFGSGFVPPLPDLRHLGVTPHDYSMIERLMTPNLKHVTLYPTEEPTVDATEVQQSPSSPQSNSPPTVVDYLIKALVPKLHTVEEVTFTEWKSRFTDMGCVSTLERLLGVPSSLHHVIFNRCHLDGPALISCLAKANGEKVDIEEILTSEERYPRDIDAPSVSTSLRFKSLGELTLSSCTGITRDECDILASTVGKLNIYL